MKHNNQLANGHFRKAWQERVKTWFNQPGAKKTRRTARMAKAARDAPRPVDGLLRPVVRAPTAKYNTKLRLGRGFTIEELKEAGIRRKEALTIGIPVDHRRKNRSAESLAANVARLRLYKSKLVVFPKNSKKPAKADAKPAEIQAAVQLRTPIQPLTKAVPVTTFTKSIPADKVKTWAYAALRKARQDAKLVGVREMRAKAKAAEEDEKKK